MNPHKEIDAYIAAAPKETQPLLKQMREAIREVAPEATETISYGIPTFKMGGNLVHFGAFKTHMSFFPTSSGVAAFAKELSKYKLSKGTVQFPLDQKLPLSLIKKIVRFRVKEVRAKR
jgi:uncharacterized protein YdhG (YjbR/CyaY superfamily)